MTTALLGEWLAGWTESQIAGLGYVSRPMLGAAIQQGLTQGFSANAMLNALKLQGVGMRRQNFLDAVRNVRASMESEIAATGYDLNDVPTAGKVPELVFGTKTTNLHRVDITATRTIDGIRGQFTSRIFVRTNEPITVEEAIARGKEIFDQMSGSEKYDIQTYLYAQYAGVIHQTARTSA